jgi:CheY-like chemotaxis protein
MAQRRVNFVAPPTAAAAALDPLRDKLIVVIDDDALVLDGTGGLLKSWGCRVVTAQSDQEAVASLDRNKPDLVISDFRLKDGRTGIDAVERLRNVFDPTIPAFLISGDILPERLHEAQAAGLHLLHKPVGPMALRTMMSRLLKGGA